MNPNGDYGYVIKETVRFFIKKCKPVANYVAVSDGHGQVNEVSAIKSKIDTVHN